MLDKGRISSVQLLFLLLIADLATSFLYVPTITTKGAGPDAWISLLFVVTAYALGVAAVCTLLAKRFPFQVFTEYLPEVIGKIPGKLLAVVYSGVLLHITSVMVVEGAQFVQTNFLIETPLLVLELVLAGVAVYGVYQGIETIARHNEIVFPIFILSVTILIILVLKDVNYNNFRPVMEKGFIPVLEGALTPGAWRGEVFIILMLFPYLNQKEEGLQAAGSMVLIAGIFATAVVATTIGVFGDLYTSRLTYPVNTLARYISVAGILERMELVIVIIWVAGVIVKLAIFYHTCSMAAATTLGWKNYRIMAVPVAAITIIAGNYFYGTYIQVVSFLSKVWPIYGATVELIIPGLILIIAALRKKEEPGMPEARNYKRHLSVFLIILMPLTVIGCWGRRETQQMNLTTALGIDRVMVNETPRFRLTVLSTKPPQSGGAGAGGSQGISEPKRTSVSQVMSIDGETIWDAGRNWNMRSSRRLFIGQVIVVVVGDETAREGLGEILDFLLRHQDMRERVWLVVCKGSAADFLNAQPENEPITSVEIDGILRNAWTRNAKVKGINLFNYSYDLLTPGREAILPYMILFEPPEPSSPIRQNPANTGPGSDSTTPENQPLRTSFVATGFAVFHGNNMIGLMNGEESQGLLFLTNQVKTTALPIAVESGHQNVSVRIQQSKTIIKPVFWDGVIKFEVDIEASGFLMEESDAVVKITKEDFLRVEELGSQEIEQRCRKAVDKSQELKSDVLGLGDKVHRTNPEEWRMVKDSWEQVFPTVVVDVKAELKVKQTGVSSDPIKIQ